MHNWSHQTDGHQEGQGKWWDDDRHRYDADQMAADLAEIAAGLTRICPVCNVIGWLWASVPYWCVTCECSATLYYDDPDDAVAAWNLNLLIHECEEPHV